MTLSSERLDIWLTAAKEIAVSAGDLVKKLAADGPKVTHKGPVDLVTDADLRAEKYIVAELKRRFPDHAILAEESGGQRVDGPLWAIDPIDGTTNYAHGFPVYAVSIGLFIEEKPVAGVVYDPNQKELFAAAKGRGATLNSGPIHVSAVAALDNALLATGFPYTLREDHESVMRDFINLSLACQGVRRAGAASIDLCALACGRFDGFWEVGLRPWDTAAAGLIVEEAGGHLSRYDGTQFDHFTPEAVASNGLLHDGILSLLQPRH